MKLENQVVSLKYAKKLKELGFKQESLWYWCKMSGEWTIRSYKTVHPADNEKYPKYSAYTVAELGKMLPKKLPIPEGTEMKAVLFDLESRINEADARAKMLIYLKEKKLI